VPVNIAQTDKVPVKEIWFSRVPVKVTGTRTSDSLYRLSKTFRSIKEVDYMVLNFFGQLAIRYIDRNSINWPLNRCGDPY